MRERISALVGIVLLVLLIGVSYFYAVRSNLADIRYLPSENSPDYVANRIALVEFGPDGAPRNRVIAARAEHYSDDRVNAEQPMYVSLTPGKAQVTARSDRGWTNDAGRTVLLDGNVRISRAPWNGTPELRFETQRLTVYPDPERFVSDTGVVFRRGADSTTASGMDYSYADGTIELAGRVRTHIVRK